jgi:hypothetical protein
MELGPEWLGFEDVYWIHLAQDRVLLTTVINFWVAWNAWIFLSRGVTIYIWF